MTWDSPKVQHDGLKTHHHISTLSEKHIYSLYTMKGKTESRQTYPATCNTYINYIHQQSGRMYIHIHT